MRDTQEKLTPMGRAKMEYGGMKELCRKLKRFHIRCLPIIYRISGMMFCFAGIMIFREIVEFFYERDLIGVLHSVFLSLYIIILIYWTIRIMLRKVK